MTSQPSPPLISVMLAVADASAAARWYASALGATELWNLGGVVGLSVAGAPFFLGEPENNGWDTPAALGSRTVRVEVFVDDPDGFIERAVAPAQPAAGTSCVITSCRGASTGRVVSSTRSAISG